MSDSMQGFSPHNLECIRRFATEWPDDSIVQRTAALLPWYVKQVLPGSLKCLRKFAEFWSKLSVVQQLVAQIHWGSNLLLIEKLKTPEERPYLKNGLSRNVLFLHIFKSLYLFAFLGIDAPRWEAKLNQRRPYRA